MDTPLQIAPDFTLTDHNGTPVSLGDFAGSWLVLYFYPKDDTPGCTVEACSFRDARDELTALGAKVVGISKDDPSTHDKFKAKYDINFSLLSDTEGKVIEAYSAWGKKMFGREGILRKTFIINPEGRIVKVYGRVTPLNHGEQVVGELQRRKRIVN
ncbi:peroxiredoxin [Candidatus Saccharibacteria bacterium]|nr:peroxiredoxin [Candidatus Saccharibacteria bacterium]